jgi:hypothetical protein
MVSSNTTLGCASFHFFSVSMSILCNSFAFFNVVMSFSNLGILARAPFAASRLRSPSVRYLRCELSRTLGFGSGFG